MVFLVVFLVLVVAGCAGVVWPIIHDLRPEGDEPHPAGTAPAAPVAAPAAGPVSLEGVLVAQLSTGEISRRQYLRAMAKVAARDDARDPLTVPPETGAGR